MTLTEERKKKEKPTPRRIRNKTESQRENYLPVFKQWKKQKKNKSTIVASHPTWPWQKKGKRETHTWKNKKQNWKPMRKKKKKVKSTIVAVMVLE